MLMNWMRTRHHKGFTLIEILVVVSIMMIVALIVIPRVMGAGRRANEASLQGNLRQLRAAIEIFHDDTDAFPASLQDITAMTPPPSGVDTDGNVIAITADSYRGPYLSRQGGLDNSGLPANPFGPPPTGTLTSDLPKHWTYAKGAVHAAVPTSGATLDEIPYSSL